MDAILEGIKMDSRAFDPAFREALDWECFGKYPLIIIICGLVILILDIWGKRHGDK